jgi:hypothetical protein
MVSMLTRNKFTIHEGSKPLRQNGHGSTSTLEYKTSETSISKKKFSKGDGLNAKRCMALFII